jgi:hypothetical protein
MAADTTGPETLPAVDLGQIVRDCRLKIATACAARGDSHALAAVACASITLQAYVEAGSLRQEAICHLAETAANLGLDDRLGEEVVGTALDAGPMLYDELAVIWERQQQQQPVEAG